MTVIPFSQWKAQQGGATAKPNVVPFSQWKQQQTDKNKPSTFQNVMSAGQNFATGVAKSELGAVAGLDKFGSGLANWLTGKGFKPSEGITGTDIGKKLLSDKNLESTGLAQSIGKYGTDIAQFFIPGGAEEEATAKVTSLLPKAGEMFFDAGGNLTKIGKAAEYGIESIMRGIGAAGVTTAQTGSPKAGATMGGITALLNTPIALGGKLLGGIFKNIASFTSGKGSDVINAITRDPSTALKGLGEDTATGLRNSSLAIKKYASDVYSAVKARYAQGLKDIESKYLPSAENFMKQGNNLITPEGTTPITLNGVKSTITSVFNQFGVEGDFVKGFNFANAPTDALKRPLTNIYNKIKNFTDISPTGLHNLTQNLTDIANKTKDPQAIAVASQIADNIRTYMSEKIPEMKALNADYSQVSKFLENMDNYLSTGVKSGIKAGMQTEEGIVQTANKLAGLFGQNKELARQFIESIPGGAKWISEQAGRTIAEGQKLTGFAGGGGMFQRALESAIPSKLTGWLTARGSQLSDILEKLTPAEQGIIRELFGHASGENTQTNSNTPNSSSSFSGVMQNNQKPQQ